MHGDALDQALSQFPQCVEILQANQDALVEELDAERAAIEEVVRLRYHSRCSFK